MGLVIICILLCCALVPSLLAPYGLDEQRPAEALQWPNLLHLMGTDNFGRDIFSRIIYGARTSIVVGFIAVGLAGIAGPMIVSYFHEAGYGYSMALVCFAGLFVLNTIIAIILKMYGKRDLHS